MNREQQRLSEATERRKHWKRWGPYVSERAWGTVREDYSSTGDAWGYFPHEQARSRAYRWNEDGIAGISDRHQFLCFALTLWNEKDPILKERLFGLSGSEGNHGEDVKEYYYYLDNTPTHSYMKYLYKYPQAEFPYERLREENRTRSQTLPEFELIDTGVFDDDRYFDVFVEYAKADTEDICIRITVANRGPEAASIRILPSLWFRNTWSWKGTPEKPTIRRSNKHAGVLEVISEDLGAYEFHFDESCEVLFTENETNFMAVYGTENPGPYVKDAFHRYLIQGEAAAVNPEQVGTKIALHYNYEIAARSEITIRFRLCKSNGKPPAKIFLKNEFEQVFNTRKAEADEFYDEIIPKACDPDTRLIMRQAFAGLLWTKQYYHYIVR